FTDKITATPRHYRTANGWVDIDNHLVADAGGGYRNRANSFVARFQSSGVRLETSEGTISMAPADRAWPTPTVDAAGDTVTYPGVDVRSRAQSTGIKEELVLRRRPATAEFAFRVQGTSLALEPDGSLTAGGTFAGKWKMPPPEVLAKDGRPAPGALPRFSVAGDTVTLAVDGSWLAGLDASADFPVVLDPSLHQVGSPTSRGYLRNPYDDGYTTCDPCQMAVGNINEPGWRTWRSVAYFPYENLYGKQILDGALDLYTMGEGTSAPYNVKVYGGDTVGYGGDWNWSNLGAYLGEASAGTSFSFDASSLTSYYQDLVNRRLPGVPVKFVGDETVGIYSYKRFFSFELALMYNDGPSVASPTGPSDGAWLHNLDSSSLVPTLSVSPASDPNGDQVYYYFRVATGADGESGVVDECPWQTATTCQVGPLNWNTTYYWRVYTSDGYW
ncbi:MAG: hypothetical protein ACRDH5_08395, partial [bacterium]